ncbi:hypothetical protein IV203_037011 [Nitzschia inconspicua]|uniref:Uncharacterized protein n=1 Tax=Nitzschia inconspicua TaxID=303405 RepID=A0A9K3K617_9STRA|nr:hypothetical protein IV203_037011 [Nitzschia inconspicua]
MIPTTSFHKQQQPSRMKFSSSGQQPLLTRSKNANSTSTSASSVAWNPLPLALSRTIPLLAIVCYSLLRLSSLSSFAKDGRWMTATSTSFGWETPLLRVSRSRSIYHHSDVIPTTMESTIFYHIQVPTTDGDAINSPVTARRRIGEQLQQIHRYTASIPSLPIMYHLDLPTEDAILEAEWHNFISVACSNCFNAHSIMNQQINSTNVSSTFHNRKNEHTLQYLWQYCLDHPSEYVTYLQSSSSLSLQNPQEHNIGMIAALECTFHLQPSEQQKCTSCGLPFHTRPSYRHLSNQWTAPCSYIRKLISPSDYPIKLQQMYHTLDTDDRYQCLRPHNITHTELLRKETLNLGQGESDIATPSSSSSSSWTSRWIHSHPSLQPCEILSQDEWNDAAQNLSQGLPTTFDWRVQDAPSHGTTFNVKGAPTSWQRLEGRLFEWHFINTKTRNYDDQMGNTTVDSVLLRPANDSWVYPYYQNAQEGIKCFKNYLSNEFH